MGNCICIKQRRATFRFYSGQHSNIWKRSSSDDQFGPPVEMMAHCLTSNCTFGKSPMANTSGNCVKYRCAWSPPAISHWPSSQLLVADCMCGSRPANNRSWQNENRFGNALKHHAIARSSKFTWSRTIGNWQSSNWSQSDAWETDSGKCCNTMESFVPNFHPPANPYRSTCVQDRCDTRAIAANGWIFHRQHQSTL